MKNWYFHSKEFLDMFLTLIRLTTLLIPLLIWLGLVMNPIIFVGTFSAFYSYLILYSNWKRIKNEYNLKNYWNISEAKKEEIAELELLKLQNKE